MVPDINNLGINLRKMQKKTNTRIYLWEDNAKINENDSPNFEPIKTHRIAGKLKPSKIYKAGKKIGEKEDRK